jgi:iron complex outermembrane receptor protein
MKKEFVGVVVVLCVASSAAWGAETVELDKIVVTPSRVGEPASEASSNVTVITREAIKNSGATNIPDVLEREAGVNVTSQNSPKNKIVDIRGSGDTAVRNILVLVNGRRINPVDISGPDWLEVPLESVERIEIIRGAASVAYGDNASAGVVNIITKSGRGVLPYATVSSEFGSYDLRRYAVEAGGEKDRLSYYVSSGYSDQNGYRQNSGILTKDDQARAGYAVNDQVRFDVEGAWHKDNYRLPGGISAAWIAAHGRRSSDSPDDYGSTEDAFVRLSSELKPFEVDGSKGTLSLDYSHRNRGTYGFLSYGAGYTSDTKLDIVTDTAGIKYVVTPQVLGRDLRLTSGVDLEDSRNKIVSSDGPDLLIRKESTGVYLLSDYALTEKLSLNAGARREEATYIFDQYNVPRYETKSPAVNAYSGGLKYEYAPRSNVFVSAARTFRFLATDEWFSQWAGLNTALKQQRGVEYQTGVVHQLDALRLGATGFVIRNRDEIFVDPTLSGGVGATSNYDRTERVGLELGADWDLYKAFNVTTLKAWNIFANTTIQLPRFSGGAFDEKVIPFVPRRQVKVGTGVTFKSGFGFDVMGRYTGSQFPINDTLNERPKVKATVVADSRVRFSWKSSEVYVGINNVFNEKYYDYVAYGHSSGNTDYYPAAERNYVAGMKYKF